MYTYDTLEELVSLLDKHFKNTERFRFNYYIKGHKFHYNIIIDGKTQREGDLTVTKNKEISEISFLDQF